MSEISDTRLDTCSCGSKEHHTLAKHDDNIRIANQNAMRSYVNAPGFLCTCGAIGVHWLDHHDETITLKATENQSNVPYVLCDNSDSINALLAATAFATPETHTEGDVLSVAEIVFLPWIRSQRNAPSTDG